MDLCQYRIQRYTVTGLKYLYAIIFVLVGAVVSITLNVIPSSVTIYQAPNFNIKAEAVTASGLETMSTQQADIEFPATTEILIEEESLSEIATEETSVSIPKKQVSVKTASVLNVPFYSQFTDISAPDWKKVGCGIASLAMLIDYYIPNPPSVDALLQEGIDSNAYLNDAGWTYAGLIGISKRYGLTGESYDLGYASMDSAFDSLQEALLGGPVMVSVHYKFEPENPIPHLVVANSVRDGMFYYNDPAAKSGNLSIPVSTFKDAWKKRYIEIRLAS